jgi:hypothetical protein
MPETGYNGILPMDTRHDRASELVVIIIDKIIDF